MKSFDFLSEYIQPPNISHGEVVDLTEREITFNWTKVVPDCPLIDYNILASNCGSCPTITNHTTATCTDIPTSDGVCVFIVQTLVCGNILGRFSNTIHIVELSKRNGNHQTTCSCNNMERLLFSGAIVSATLLGGIVSACVTILITMIMRQRRKAKAEQESPDCLYDDVTPKQSSQTESAIIDIRKNVAYGQIISQHSS